MNDRCKLFKQYLEEGLNQKDAAIKAHINPRSTTYYINKYNLKVKTKFNTYYHNNDYFNIIDTEAKAYLLGFILADGYITYDKKSNSISKRLCFNNSIDDIEVINLVKSEISPNSKIIISNKQKGVKFRKEQVTIRINSKEIVNILESKYNIKKAKTYDNTFSFNFNNLPEELYRHFIRGYFDGDGSVSFHKKENKNIFFNFSFIFNSEDFCNQIANIFEDKFKIIPVKYYHKGKTANWYSLRFNYNRKRKDKIKEIYKYFYEDSNCFLTRKKLKFEEYFKYRANLIDNTIKQCNA